MIFIINDKMTYYEKKFIQIFGTNNLELLQNITKHKSAVRGFL